MKRLLNLVIAVTLGGAVVASEAGIVRFAASLSGPNESPANTSPGIGVATVDFDSVLNTLFIQTSFSGLLGTTAAAHIHCCTLDAGSGTAAVATVPPSFVGFPLGVSAGTYSGTLDLTQLSSYNPPFVTAHGGTAASAEVDLIAGLLTGRTYFNIHTTVFPGGEIRGFLQAIPEPMTIGLMGFGLVLIALLRRRRRRR